MNENCIEFLNGQKTATITFGDVSRARKMRKLYETNKEEFDYFVENPDGSICCKVPLKWVKVRPPKKISDEQRAAAAERLAKARMVQS